MEFNSYVEQVKNSLTDNRVVYPFEELRKAAKDDFVFFKQTQHWTDWGAYNGYLALMNVVRKDFPDIHVSGLDEYKMFTSKLIREDWNRKFEAGQTRKALNISSEYATRKLLKDDYKYYDHKQMIIPKTKLIPKYRTKYFVNKNQSSAPKLFLIGTSMNEDLLQFLPYSFSETQAYRLNSVSQISEKDVYKLMKRYKNDILQFKPDVLILCVTVCSNLHRLGDLMAE